MKAIVVGLGNPLLLDDGLGPYLTERLQTEHVLDKVDYYLTDESGLYLAEKLVGYEQALIIDSLKTSAANWGKVWLFTPDDFQATAPGSAHGIDLFAALKFLRYSGVKIPVKVGLVAVGVKSNTIFADHFSSAIEQRKEKVYQEVKYLALDFFA